MSPYPQSCKTFLLIAGRVKRSRPITLVSCRSGFYTRRLWVPCWFNHLDWTKTFRFQPRADLEVVP